MDQEQIVAEIRALNERVTTIFKRIDEYTKLLTSVQDLALSVREHTTELKHLGTEIEGVRDDVDEIKSHSGKQWDAVVKTAITALVGGIIAYALLKTGFSA